MGDPGEERASTREHSDPAAVRAVYDDIAAHFAKTRAYPWPEIEEFLAGKEGGIGLDLGCGNGRHAELLADRVDRVLAVDASRGLLSEARDRLDEGWPGSLLQGDAARLPLAAKGVDVAIYVATLHHLPDRETRVASLAELRRVLTDGGVALVSAWSTAHDRFEHDGSEVGFDTTIDWTLPDGERRERFYHIYAPAEFEADLRRAGLTIEHSRISSGNCYAAVRK